MSQYQNINQSHLKNDECYINQQNKENKSIFNYMTDQTKFINNNECFDLTPPFLNYIPAGTPKQNGRALSHNQRSPIHFSSG